jgi:hypothetical protein
MPISSSDVLEEYSLIDYRGCWLSDRTTDVLFSPFKNSAPGFSKVDTDFRDVMAYDCDVEPEALSNEELLPILEMDLPKRIDPRIAAAATSLAKVAPKKKRPSLAGSGTMSRRRGSRADFGVDAEMLPAPKRRRESQGAGMDSASRVPINLHSVLAGIHQIFWTMKDLDPASNFTFFSVITRQNCKQLSVPDFFDRFPLLERAHTLPTIKEKLDKKLYASPSEFSYEFQTMFDCIISYFPPDSAQGTTAQRLKGVFAQHWQQAEAQFIY